MIAQPTYGKYLKGLLVYNLDKVDEGKGNFIYANNLENSLDTFVHQYHYLVAEQRNVNNLLHLSLNFPQDDVPKLNADFYISLTKDFLTGYGFPADHPFAIFEHKDKKHPHIHVATPLCTDQGKVSLSHSVLKMIKLSRTLEKKHGLKQVEKGTRQKLTPVAVEGSYETAIDAIQAGLKAVISNKPASFKEFEKGLKKAVVTYNGTPAVVDYQISKKGNGLSYFLRPAVGAGVDKTGQLDKAVKGSKIPGYSYPLLLKQFENISITKNRYSNMVEAKIQECLSSLKTKSITGFVNALNAKKIQPTFFRSKDGNQIFGVEFKDLSTGITYKGSDLNKDLSWNKLKTVLVEADQQAPQQVVKNNPSPKTSVSMKSIQDLKRDISLIDLAGSLGYVHNQKKSDKRSVMMERGDDKILIYQHGTDNAGLYYTTMNHDGDKGDIVNLLVNKGVCSDFKEALRYLNNLPEAKLGVPEKIVSMPKQKVAAPLVMVPQDKHDGPSYITAKRHISQEILDKHFAGTVFRSATVNTRTGERDTIFPLFHCDSGAMVGQVVRSAGFKHIVENSDKINGIWRSPKVPGAPNMIMEDPLDAISHKMLNPDVPMNYIATIGAASAKIIEYISKLSESESIILAGDNDVDGQHFNMRIAVNVLSKNTDAKFAPSNIKDAENYKLTVEASDRDALEMHFKAIDGITIRGIVESKAFIEIDEATLTATFEKSPENVFSFMNELLATYKVDKVSSVKPTEKDFNDVLKKIILEDKKKKQQMKNNG